MASITFNGLFLHEAADLSVYRRIRVRDIQEDAQVDTRIRKYASGRLRARTTEGYPRRLNIELVNQPREIVNQLRAWRGVELFLRGPRGRAFHGIITALSFTEYSSLQTADVSFEFAEVTDSVEV